MLIDRNNYESHFLDFREGRLTEQEIEEIMVFLKSNPDLEDELLHFDSYVLESNHEITFNKNFLFKSLDNFHSINEYNFDEFCVSYYEKDLSAAACEELSKYLISHPGKLQDFENYGKVYLDPPLNVTYPFKSKLKKFILLPIYKLALISSSAAAILLIIMYLIPFIRLASLTNKQTIAIAEKQTNNRTENPNRVSEVVSAEDISGSEKRIQINQGILSTKQLQLINGNTSDSVVKEAINLKLINSIKINDLKPLQFYAESNIMADLGSKNVYKNAPHYLSIREFAISILHKNIEPNISEKTDETKFTWWDLARLGVSGINKITGSEIKVDRKMDEDGKIIAMAVESGKLGFSRSMNK